jgi:hypothetical protein
MKLKLELEQKHSIKSHLEAFNEMYENNFDVCIHSDIIANGKRKLVIGFFGDKRIRDVYFFGYLARKKQIDVID